MTELALLFIVAFVCLILHLVISYLRNRCKLKKEYQKAYTTPMSAKVSGKPHENRLSEQNKVGVRDDGVDTMSLLTLSAHTHEDIRPYGTTTPIVHKHATRERCEASNNGYSSSSDEGCSGSGGGGFD